MTFLAFSIFGPGNKLNPAFCPWLFCLLKTVLCDITCINHITMLIPRPFCCWPIGLDDKASLFPFVLKILQLYSHHRGIGRGFRKP